MINLYAKFPLCLVPVSKITELKMGLDTQNSIFRVILVRFVRVTRTLHFICWKSKTPTTGTHSMGNSCSSRVDLNSWLCYNNLVDRHNILYIALRCLSFTIRATSLEKSFETREILLCDLHYPLCCVGSPESALYFLGGCVTSAAAASFFLYVFIL